MAHCVQILFSSSDLRLGGIILLQVSIATVPVPQQLSPQQTPPTARTRPLHRQQHRVTSRLRPQEVSGQAGHVTGHVTGSVEAAQLICGLDVNIIIIATAGRCYIVSRRSFVALERYARVD